MKFIQYPFQLIVHSFFFSFSVNVIDGYGKTLLDSYCGPKEGSFFIASSLNISVKVASMSEHYTFTARYSILNGSIDSGKELNSGLVTSLLLELFMNYMTLLFLDDHQLITPLKTITFVIFF